MSILLFGRNGQVGFELRRALAPLGKVYAVNSAECNLADAGAVSSIIREVRPQVVVNAAAYTAVDKAESEPETARAVNTVAPARIGQEAARIGASVIHFSTDYVFDGAADVPYDEDDLTNPLGVYGQTKLDGERALAEATPMHLIMRTSWVAGAHGTNFAKTMLRLAAERDGLRVVADQHGTPTSAALLADVTAHLVDRIKRDGAVPFGLYHVTAAGEATWHEYARFVIDAAWQAGRPLRTRPENVVPIRTADYPTTAKRPANSRLNTSLFRETFGLTLPPWQEGIDHILRQIL